MNTIQIIEGMQSALRDYPNLFRTHFKGVFPYNHLPQRKQKTPYAYIFNTEPSGQEGEHWVAVFQAHEQQPIEYFDSYGFPPPPHLEHIASSSKIIRNTRQIQSYCSTLCGEYCVVFLTFRILNVSLHELISHFSDDPELNDVYLFHIIFHALTSL